MKSEIVTEISGKLSALGVPIQNGNGTDILVSAEFLDAKWATGKKSINYEASVFVSEEDEIIYFYEKTVTKGSGLSFGMDSGTSFQSGTTLFQKVKSIQYGPDGKAYEYSLDLGSIPKTVKDAAKQHGWKFKLVLSRDKASYPHGYVPPIAVPSTPKEASPQKSEEADGTAAGYCSNCGAPLAAGAKFCDKCGTPLNSTAPIPEPVPRPAPQPVPQPQSASTPRTEPQSKNFSDPKGKFFSKSQSQGKAEFDGKTKKPKAILFWIIWAVLTLLCVMMIFGEFSLLRLVGFAVIVAFPVFFKNKFFKKFLPSLLSWIVIFILLFVIIALTGKKATTTGYTVQKQSGVSVSMLEGSIPAKSTINITKDLNPPAAAEGIKYEAYDISLPTGSTMEGVAEIVIPFDKSMIPSGTKPEDVLSVAYYNAAEKVWEPMPYIINADKGSITVLTDHFSKYAVVYFKDGRKKLTAGLSASDGFPISYYTGAELEKVVSEMASGSSGSMTAFNAGWNKFNTYYGIAGASGNVLTAAVDSKTVGNINELMTEAGGGFAIAQLALDMYNGDNAAACNNFVKNAANYSAAKWAGSAVSLASVGVTFIDIALNKFAETALDKNLQKFEDTYREYYNTKAKRSAVDWYKIVKKLQAEAQSPAQFKAKLDAELDTYCDLFWKDVTDGYTKVSDKTALGVGGEYAIGVNKISGNYKQYLYNTTMKPVMAVLLKNISYQEYKKAAATFNKIKAEMNKEYTITINLANYSQVKNLKGTMARFKNATGQVAHSQSFDENGRAVVKMSLFGFLKAGNPTTIEVKVPAQDNTPEYNTTLTYTLNNTNIVLNAPYVPLEKPADKPTQSTAPQNTSGPQTTSPTYTAPPTKTQAPVQTTAPKEYNYNAALAAWAADYAAAANKRTYDDGNCKTTYQFEWVKAPYIQNGQVMGASKMFEIDVYYNGPRKGETVKYYSSYLYDAGNPGVYISTGDLKKKYPQFG